MTLSGWLSDLEELSGAAEGSYRKVVCFGQTIELRLKYRMIRIESKLFDPS